jgi:hypothetical protein
MLRGSLADLAIVDLVQIPLGNQKTGELLIATENDDARLYYVEGNLVHLVTGEIQGPPVLDVIVGWTDGEFEFRSDVLSDEASFKGDLNPTLRKAVERYHDKREVITLANETTVHIRRLLFDFLSTHDFAIHACLMHPNGTMDVCGADRVDTPAWLEKLRYSVLDLVGEYPRKELHRVLFEDKEGTLVVSCYPEDRSALLVVAKHGTTLGAVSIAVDRLARKIGDAKGG